MKRRVVLNCVIYFLGVISPPFLVISGEKGGDLCVQFISIHVQQSKYRTKHKECDDRDDEVAPRIIYIYMKKYLILCVNLIWDSIENQVRSGVRCNDCECVDYAVDYAGAIFLKFNFQ